MTDNPTADQLPTIAHIDALRAFLDARHEEASVGARGAAAHRTHTILFTRLAAGAIGYVAASRKDEEAPWIEGDRYRWWLLVEILRAYNDHPDFPEALRPFLNEQWR
jgi:hypothetical protein